MPPRPSKGDLLATLNLYLLGVLMVVVAATMPDGTALLVLGFLMAGLSSVWWRDYWRKRDDWRRWQRAREEERADGE